MFGLSFGEVLIVLVVALLVLGPERLPKVARSVGKGLRDLRRTTGGIREILEDEIYLDEVAERRPATPPAGAEEGGPVPRGPAHAAPPAGAVPAQGAGEGGEAPAAETAAEAKREAES